MHHPKEMKLSSKVCALFLAMLVMSATACFSPKHAEEDSAFIFPQKGVVPDEQTAISIAKAVLLPIFGAKTVAADEPFAATDEGDVWVVTGAPPPPGTMGGSATVRILRRDGRVLWLGHTR